MLHSPLKSYNCNLQSSHDNSSKEGRNILILLVGLSLLFFLMLLILVKEFRSAEP